jgi:hypothetical protein
MSVRKEHSFMGERALRICILVDVFVYMEFSVTIYRTVEDELK